MDNSDLSNCILKNNPRKEKSLKTYIVKGFLIGLSLGLVIIFIDWYIPTKGCVFGIEDYSVSWGCSYTYIIKKLYVGYLFQELYHTNFYYFAYIIYIIEIVSMGIMGAAITILFNKLRISYKSKSGLLLMFVILLIFLVSAKLRYYPVFSFINSTNYCSHLKEDQGACLIDRAILLENHKDTSFPSILSVCDNIKNIESKNYCNRSVAISELKKTNVLSSCDILTDLFDKGECYSRYAEQSDNVDICYKIENDTALEECIGYFTYNYIQYKPKNPNIEICDRIDDKYIAIKDGCYMRIITQGGIYDSTICNKVIDYPKSSIYEPDYCYYIIATHNNTEDMCKKMKTPEYINKCTSYFNNNKK